MNVRTTSVFMVVLLVACLSCSRERQPDGTPDLPAAQKAYETAIEARKNQDVQGAEEALRRALGFNPYHGAAQNDLGVILLERGKLYEAAQAFENARGLLPRAAAVRCNLAIAWLRAGRLREALEPCKSALEIDPEHLQSLETLCWLQLRLEEPGDDTLKKLRVIIARTPDKAWSDWARVQVLRLEGRVSESCLSGPTPQATTTNPISASAAQIR